MSRELLVLRHAKSAWDTDASSDFERPLSKRGRKAAPRMGRWIRENDLQPDFVLASTALRVRQTVHALLPELDREPPVVWEDTIYEASIAELLTLLSACPPDHRRVLLVGHNPGLESLVAHLSGRAHLFPTAALAHFTLPSNWSTLMEGAGSLDALIRPRELED
ncbi:MAG: histidine phosphatase family protein [Planctomycetota bacterium]